MHILILGGTTEASQLAGLLAARPEIRATLSLAGRTQHPVLPAIAHRVGGFGGAAGLAAWMIENDVGALIDATHPFARRMPFNAAQAALDTGIPLLSLVRPAWASQSGDQWSEVADHTDATRLLGSNRKRVFLTVGRLELGAYAEAAQHFYLVRSIDPVDDKPLRDALWITSRPPFSVEGEKALMGEHAIQVLITKNSGGGATVAKLAAARELGVPVILIKRPQRPNSETVATAQEAMSWIHALCL